MARYGSKKYGSFKYGTSTVDRKVTWSVEIAWNGSFDGSNDGLRMQRINTSRGRNYFLKAAGDGFETVQAGSAMVTLKNFDRRYDSFNTESPLYPNISPGKKVRISVKDETSKIVYPVFFGSITDIQPQSDPDLVILSLTDNKKLLESETPAVELQRNISVRDALLKILDAIAWPDGVNIDSIRDLLFVWSTTGQNAASEIEDLVEMVFGIWFIAADGRLRVKSRHQNLTSVETLTGLDILRDLSYPQAWETIRNKIEVVNNAIDPGETTTIHQYKDKPFIKAGESLNISITLSSLVSSIQAPVAGVDYSANTDLNGKRTELSSSFLISLKAYYKKVDITITNQSAYDGYLLWLNLHGDPITFTPSTIEAEDPQSIAQYGKSVFKLDNPWMHYVYRATNFAHKLLSVLSSPSKFPVVKLMDKPDLQFTPELFDLIHLSISSKGIDQIFTLGSISHESIDEGCQTMITTFRFEPVLFSEPHSKLPVTLPMTVDF